MYSSLNDATAASPSSATARFLRLLRRPAVLRFSFLVMAPMMFLLLCHIFQEFSLGALANMLSGYETPLLGTLLCFAFTAGIWRYMVASSAVAPSAGLGTEESTAVSPTSPSTPFPLDVGEESASAPHEPSDSVSS